MEATVYCMCNQKGGCAKSVSSVNLGIGLARGGKRVLVHTNADKEGVACLAVTEVGIAEAHGLYIIISDDTRMFWSILSLVVMHQK